MAPLAALALLLVPSAVRAVEVRQPPGALHGFPSMSDPSGEVVADGELAQQRHGDRLTVRARWTFGDGREAREEADFQVGAELVQLRFAWVESERGEERRRFEVDFRTGAAFAVVDEDGERRREEATLELIAGQGFAGYGVALAISQLPLDPGERAELVLVAFTPKPRTVTLEVRNEGEEAVRAAGRSIPCERFRLHPKIPFPVSLFAKARDARLWMTRAPPRALVRAEQNLVTKDDPVVVIDVIPRGARRADVPR